MLPIPPFSSHHIHPILVNYTAALIPTSIGCDVLRVVTRRNSFSSTAWWTMCFGVAVTPLTAAAGWLLMNATHADDQSSVMRIHEWLGLSIAALIIPVCIGRGVMHRNDRQPGVIYFCLAGLLLIALVYQGHLGGSMSFG